MECILVDDCTPDDSMEIAERLIAEYEGQVTFHIIRHEQNGGLPVARNTGMAHATGDYLLFVDSDDYLTDDCIRKLTDVVRAFPEVQVVKGNHIGRASVISSHVPGGPLDNDTILELLYMGVIPVMVWNTLIKRSVIVQGQLSFRQGLVFEDNLWSVYLFRSIDFFMFKTSPLHIVVCQVCQTEVTDVYRAQQCFDNLQCHTLAVLTLAMEH